MELGNALLGTHITDQNLLQFNTLPGTFFSNLKNDISCLFGSTFLLIIEHQTTDNRNMPFRMLCYAVELYQKFIADTHIDMYNPHLQKLPPPVFVVFHDNRSTAPEHTRLHLSDAFGGDSRFLDMHADVYNIFGDAGQALKAKCDYLRQYSVFSTKHRTFRETGMDGDTAIRETIKYCLANNVMVNYIKEHESEVFRMLHNEWDSDAERAGYMAAGREEGRVEGREEGILTTLRNIMLNTHCSIEQALHIAGISPDQQPHFAAMLQV